LVATNPEGYVAVDHKGNGIKFVDRLEFSRANFAVDKGEKFTGKLSEEEEIELDIEDEDSDPVVDTDFSKTIAIVPGAFKPPHKGHLDMVRAYADQADEVIVLISRPTKSGRKLSNNREITAEDSEAIWKVLAAELGNVDIRISTHASPLTAAYEYIGEEGPISVGDKVALGCSNKGGDCKRWAAAPKYIKQGVGMVPVTGVEPSKHSDAYIDLLNSEREKQSELYNNMPSVKANKDPSLFHASDLRYLLVESVSNDTAYKLLGDFVGDQNIDNVLSILDLVQKVDEMSSMAGGAVAGYGAPLGSGLARPKKKARRKKRKSRKNENIAIANEVMKLIKERGTLR